MENVVYKLPLKGNGKEEIEFGIVSTNVIGEPGGEIKEMGLWVVLAQHEIAMPGDLSEEGLDSLITFLINCRDYCKKFNSQSGQK